MIQQGSKQPEAHPYHTQQLNRLSENTIDRNNFSETIESTKLDKQIGNRQTIYNIPDQDM